MASDSFERKWTRRQFLAWGGLTAASIGLMPSWVSRAAELAKEKGRGKTLIVLFQRGAADGLNIVVPFRDPIYAKSRPSIHLDDPTRSGGVLDLDGRFGLHPGLSALMPLWTDKRLAIVHAAGSHEPTRSHFDAQDNMETGTPGLRATEDGWLNRALGRMPAARKDPLAAVALAPRLPRILRGKFPVLATNDIQSFRFGGGPLVAESFESMYQESIDALLSGAGRATEESLKILQSLQKSRPTDQDLETLGYPKGRLARSFSDFARIIKADIGLRVGFLEVGGWDHHFNEGAGEGQLAKRLEELSRSIAAFYQDLGDRTEDVLTVTMTEFGRTLQENGNGGTDHGHASVMFLAGGRVRGGKVYGRWPGLDQENLFEGRDLQVTTDFREVCGEALARHLRLADDAPLFPGFASERRLGFLPEG